MNANIVSILTALFCLFLAACGLPQPAPTPGANLPNPASVHCEESGGELVMERDASGGVRGLCILPDGTVCDEWAYYRGACGPAEAAPAAQPIPERSTLPAESPAPGPASATDDAGWWTYEHSDPAFSLRLPPGWEVVQAAGDPLMAGHLLTLRPEGGTEPLQMRMTFRHVGEEVLLWPTGAGEGEFVVQGTLAVAGGPVRRVFLVCPGGAVNAIYYQGDGGPTIVRGDLELAFLLGHTGTHCQAGYGIAAEAQHLGDMIVASLETP